MHEWRTVPLARVADIRVSNVDKRFVATETPVSLCNYMDVYANDYIRSDLPFMSASATKSEIARFKLQRGDVLITKDSETPDDIGIPAVVSEDVQNLVCGYHLALIRPNQDEVDPVFLCKQLARPETARYFGRYAAGSTRYGLPIGALARTPIALAPMDQQRKIAATLASLDTVIEKTEALIEKHQQIKAGLLHALFTRGMSPDGQIRPTVQIAPHLYRRTPLGFLPQEWRETTCASECSIGSGITLGPHRRPDKNPFPYLRVGNVFRDDIRLADVAYLEAFRGEEAMSLKVGDLLEKPTEEIAGEGAVAVGRCPNSLNERVGRCFSAAEKTARPSFDGGENTVRIQIRHNGHHPRDAVALDCPDDRGGRRVDRVANHDRHP